jgi:hypothetical protein
MRVPPARRNDGFCEDQQLDTLLKQPCGLFGTLPGGNSHVDHAEIWWCFKKYADVFINVTIY